MAARAVRSEKLDLWLSPSDTRRLRAAASASGRSVRDFVRESALARTEETLSDGRRTFLPSKAQWAEFQAALDAPTRPLPRMKNLLIEPGFFDTTPLHRTTNKH